MTKFLDAVWKTLEIEVNKFIEHDENIYLDVTLKKDFFKLLEENYRNIKKKYMKDCVNNLDRHKVAAVVIISILQIDLIKYDKDVPKGEMFIGKEIIATQIALSIMCDFLNDRIAAVGINHKISSYYMPHPMSCETPYFLVFVRNLVYSKEDFVLNPLDISEKLFLLETITLIKNNIDPDILSESKY